MSGNTVILQVGTLGYGWQGDYEGVYRATGGCGELQESSIAKLKVFITSHLLLALQTHQAVSKILSELTVMWTRKM